MDLVLISASALIAACLTFFSGFGLGTILTPVFVLFFPVTVAIAMTAVVHLANNFFKVGLVARDTHWATVLRFAFPASIAAIAGAGILSFLSTGTPWVSYEWLGRTHIITPVKTLIGVVITVFAVLELSPSFARLRFPALWLPIGGLASGFFGGLSGNQGAVRSAFLIKLGLSKEAYIATGTMCTIIVDVVRLAVYGLTWPVTMESNPNSQSVMVVVCAVISAFLGTYFGKHLLKKVTLRYVERSVAAMMGAIGTALTFGLL